jgi:hypothetical protein
MLIDYSRDGEKFDFDRLQKKGFKLHDNDFRKNKIRNNAGEFTGEYETVFNFVGFLFNNKNDVFSVFPKNFEVKDINEDSGKLFGVISKHHQKSPDLYLGDEYGERLKSDYPFASFFGVYNHYIRFGLHFEDTKHIKPNIGGKINWKETVRLSDKFVSNNKISIFPIYYEKKYYYSSLLTECMVFVINYTIDKFGVFIEFEKIDIDYVESFFFDDKELIIEHLYLLRQQTFKDNLLILIDHLINFFTELNEGGSHYLKHYAFSSIWEDMVMDYLKVYFKEIQDDKIIFGDKRDTEINFTKPTFHPNSANRSQYFSPDYYYTEENTQFIFDAKYYTKIKGMDYKQISYYLFLNECRDDVTGPKKYFKTYSALILPGERRESKIHFQMDPKFNLTNKNLVISEEYLNIREIIDFYLFQDSSSTYSLGSVKESLIQESVEQISGDIINFETIKEEESAILNNLDISEDIKNNILESKLVGNLEKVSNQIFEKFKEEDILNHSSCESIKNFLTTYKDSLEEECYRFIISAASIIFYSSKYLEVNSFDYSLQASGLWKAIEVELNASLIYLIRFKMSICTADKYYEKHENCLSRQCITTSQTPRTFKVWLTNSRNEENKLDNILLGTFPFLLNNILDDTNDNGAMKTIYSDFEGIEGEDSFDCYISMFKSFTEEIVDIRNPYVHKDSMNTQVFEKFIKRVFNDDPEQFDFNDLIKFKLKVKQFIREQNN